MNRTRGFAYRIYLIYATGACFWLAHEMAHRFRESLSAESIARAVAKSPKIEYPAPPDPLDVFKMFERYNRLGLGHVCTPFTGVGGQTWCTLCGLAADHRIHELIDRDALAADLDARYGPDDGAP